MPFVDFHMHSHYSDGFASPGFLLNEVQKNGISYFSITDHNCMGDYTDRISCEAKEKGITYIQGIEVSTLDRTLGFSNHILGYSKQFNRETLYRSLTGTVNGYTRRATAIIEKLNVEFPNFDLTLEGAKISPHEAYVTRNGIGEKLFEHLKGRIPLKELIQKYVFVQEDDSWMIRTEDAFDIINQAGGAPVWAHSGRLLKKMGRERYFSTLMRYKNSGLKGLEVYYPSHDKETVTCLKQMAKQLDLFISGGSDWHNKSFQDEGYRKTEMPRSELELFLCSL